MDGVKGTQTLKTFCIRNAMKAMLKSVRCPARLTPPAQERCLSSRCASPRSANALQPPSYSSATFAHHTAHHATPSSGPAPPRSASALCDSDSFASAVHPASRFAFGAASRLCVSTTVFSCGRRPRPAASHRRHGLDTAPALRACRTTGSEESARLVCLLASAQR